MKRYQENSFLNRILSGCQVRARHRLRHILLRSIELLPESPRYAWKNYLFTNVPSLFKGEATYDAWLKAFNYFVVEPSPMVHLVALSKTHAPSSLPAKKIAIHAHIFYLDLAPELAQVLQDFPAPFDLLISTPDSNHPEALEEQFKNIPNLQKLVIHVTVNRGRDLGPLLFGFGKTLLSYDYFAHIHTKKSSGANKIGDGWRKYLVTNLLQSRDSRVLKILKLLENYGFIYPQKYSQIDVLNCQWGGNFEAGTQLCRSLGIPPPEPGFIEFPVGSMFWANTAALRPLLEKSFTADDFDQELGQTDNTLAHALERSLSHIAASSGYQIAVLKDPSLLSSYP
jgi:lipopolysaccharide biosynthesis protein